jgi:cysteine-rich repeat protein
MVVPPGVDTVLVRESGSFRRAYCERGGMHMRTLAIFMLILLAVEGSSADPQPGALLATEAASGSIVDVSSGGDFTGDPRFATGLTTPTGICIGPGGDVYAAESAGDLHVVTAGGDFSAAVPFATGLGNAIGLYCSDTEILVADNLNGRVVDATAGGDFASAPGFATDLDLLSHVFRAANGRLYAQTADGDIHDVTAGGDFSLDTPVAFGPQGSGGIVERNGRLLAADGQGAQVFDFTGGGSLGPQDVFASGVPANALLDVPGLGLFTAAGNGSGVFEISAGGDLSGEPPFASGVATTFGLAGLVYVAGCGDAIEQPGEECDDGNTLTNDGCDDTCQAESLCGAVPANGCIQAGKGKLTIDERRNGKEKVAIALTKLVGAVANVHIGNPVTGTTRYAACLYDGANAFRGELQVARGGESCGTKPCWRAKGASGIAYADPVASSDGVSKIAAKGGADGKGKIALAARNKAAKGQTALPAIAAGLAGATSATVQVVASDGACFELPIANVKKAELDLFSGTGP